MQEMVNEYFTRFVGIVRAHRRVTEPAKPDINDYKQVDYAGIFSGRIFSGAEGKKRGLVDETGMLPDAIELAKSLADAKNAKVVMYRRPYGYSGSIYASSTLGPPKAGGTTIDLPGAEAFVPAGFYYMWRPGI